MNRLIQFFHKPYRYAILFAILLISISTYTLLDVFIIPHSICEIEAETNSSAAGTGTGNGTGSGSGSGSDTGSDSDTGTNLSGSGSDSGSDSSIQSPIITDTGYEDSNIKITISTIRQNNTNIYVADVKLAGIEYLKTALANNRFGTNVTAKTSAIASSNNAILAINGDYYGANKSGYVIKNGTLLRSSVRGDSSYDDLVILPDGNFQIISEKNVTANELLSQGVTQLFGFGPTLIEDHAITINTNTEVDQSMTSNPRTAIGIIEPLHYVFVVSDGRTSESKGLSLYQLASVMSDYNCEIAYNLDGGGSSTMYFNGAVINKPTTNGKNLTERAVSDIVYIGY